MLKLCSLRPGADLTHLAISGDMMAVLAVLRPAGSSCFTLATVGVMGSVRTGTCRVSAVTTRVSALTWRVKRVERKI